MLVLDELQLRVDTEERVVKISMTDAGPVKLNIRQLRELTSWLQNSTYELNGVDYE